MRITIVSILDEISGFYQSPLSFHNEDEAIRYFTWLCKGTDSNVGRFPEHHHLYKICEFDTDTGFTGFFDANDGFYRQGSPELLISGISVKKENNNG